MEDNENAKLKQFLETNWQNYIEKANLNKENLIDQLKEYGLDSKFLQKEYQDGKFLYIQSEELGISLQLESNILNCVYIYGGRDKKFKQYKGFLPYLINFELTNGDIVKFLGEPSTKNGGKLTSISIAYEHLGIEFTFGTKNWSEKDSLIEFICLFKKETNGQYKICGNCKNPTNNQCSRCKLIYYCSASCQKEHFQNHKEKCKQYAQQFSIQP